MHQQSVLAKVACVWAPMIIVCYTATYLLINKASKWLFSNWLTHKMLIELFKWVLNEILFIRLLWQILSSSLMNSSAFFQISFLN